MANRSRKLRPKTSKINQPHAGATKLIAKKPPKKRQRGSWLSSILVVTILLGSVGLIGACAWISFLFIFNPDQLSRLNKFLPTWAQIPLGQRELPQTLTEIKLSLSQQKQIAGETLPLDEDSQNSFLLPVFRQRARCQSDCQELVELRIYQRSDDWEFQSEPEIYYRLATQLPITGPDESFVNAPLVDEVSEQEDGKIPLPLTEVKRFEGETPLPGTWFYLRGQRQEGQVAIAYGHIVYYNPEGTHLQQMLSWTSPSGQLPKWQQVTGGGAKELVVDQTIDLEPHLRVYQVKQPIKLEAITLKPLVLKDSAYKDALLLARSGLWTPAFELLKSIQKQRKGGLPKAAQGQLDLIRLHSQLTKTQADKSWVSPSQQVLVDLMDGRWQKALDVFAASPHNAQEIATLLKANEGRLWNRTAVALRVTPNKPELQTWVTLILAVRQGEESAKSWLQAQPKTTPETLAYTQGLLAKLNGEVPISELVSTHPSQIVGSAQQIKQVTSTDWLRPDSTADLKLSNNQVWYQVQISEFHDGQGWLSSPFENLSLPNIGKGKFLWETLGISSDPTIQIVVWLPNGEQQITTATIKAVQLRGGALLLLAAGDKITQNQNNARQSKPLALTNDALEWVQPSPITLQELFQQDPQRVQTILPIVWRSLQKSGDLPPGAVPSFQQMQAQMGYWPVQVLNLSNNAKPEVVLTISAAAIAALKQPTQENVAEVENQARPRTLILSANGQVIYTDFGGIYLQRLIAIAKLADEQNPALLVENVKGYGLKRWSENDQRFQ